MINHVVAVLFLDFYHTTLPSFMFLIYIHIGYSYIYSKVNTHIFIVKYVIVKFLKMVCIKLSFWCFFMRTVHVEPTEDSFSVDLMFMAVNINYFQGFEKYYANHKISALIIS